MKDKKSTKNPTEIIELYWPIFIFIIITGALYAAISDNFLYYMGYVFILLLLVLTILWTADLFDTKYYNKQIDENNKKEQNESANLMIFENTQAAFEYACNYKDFQIVEKKGIISLVIDRDMKINKEGDLYYIFKIKLASQPDIIFSSKLKHGLNTVPKEGDLVIWSSGEEYASTSPQDKTGYIISTVQPRVHLQKGWMLTH